VGVGRVAIERGSDLSSPLCRALAFVFVMRVSKGSSSSAFGGGSCASQCLSLSESLELAACKGNEGGEVDGDVVLGKPLLVLVEIVFEFSPVNSVQGSHLSGSKLFVEGHDVAWE
jgi:hypothetical protein